jgi:LacI family transcriptional regulator
MRKIIFQIRGAMGLTQKEIARNLGISYMTVNRALNNNGYVSKELREKILSYASEMGYEPHRASQVLVRNTTRTIALFSSSLPEYFWEEVDKGVRAAAAQLRAFNYEVHYHRIPELDTDAYLRELDQEIDRGVAGIAVVNQRKYRMGTILHRIEEAGVPYVTFNVDAPKTKRLCYIGSDYQAGGRLAADFIAKTLQLSPKKEVLVLQCNEELYSLHKEPDINKMRLEGFLSLMQSVFPEITVHVEYFDTRLQVGYKDNQILNLVQQYRDRVQAMYLIPAFNTDFVRALETTQTKGMITVLHDLDTVSLHQLQTRLLSAVIHQSPTLQGYYTVKTLEQIIEQKVTEPLPTVEIDHNLVLTENRDLIQGILATRLMH